MSSKLILVTGKGGVGKTRLSLLSAKENNLKSVQWIGAKSALLREAKNIQFSIDSKNILEPERAQLYQVFLEETIRVKKLAQILANTKIFQSLLQLAPNLYEILLIRKWIEQVKENKNNIVVDAPSTGNFLALFEALETAKNLFEGGSLKKIAEDALYYLKSSTDIELRIVSIAEHSALEEMKEIENKIKSRFPNFKIKKILNRKHLAPQLSEYEYSEGWPLQIRELCFKRPQMEDLRIENDGPFSGVLNEGSTDLEFLKEGE